jgi:hypothetical protein
MKVFISLCVLFVGAYCAPMLGNQLTNEWALFKRVHHKQYNTIEEESSRYVMTDFFSNLKVIFFISFIVETSGKQILTKFVNIILKLTLAFILIH